MPQGVWVDLASGPAIPSSWSAPPPFPTMFAPEAGPAGPSRGRSPGCCNRSKQATRVQQTLEEQKEREASMLFEQAQVAPCPECGKRDALTRQRSSNLINNRRCSQ